MLAIPIASYRVFFYFLTTITMTTSLRMTNRTTIDGTTTIGILSRTAYAFVGRENSGGEWTRCSSPEREREIKRSKCYVVFDMEKDRRRPSVHLSFCLRAKHTKLVMVIRLEPIQWIQSHGINVRAREKYFENYNSIVDSIYKFVLLHINSRS